MLLNKSGKSFLKDQYLTFYLHFILPPESTIMSVWLYVPKTASSTVFQYHMTISSLSLSLRRTQAVFDTVPLIPICGNHIYSDWLCCIMHHSETGLKPFMDGATLIYVE